MLSIARLDYPRYVLFQLWFSEIDFRFLVEQHIGYVIISMKDYHVINKIYAEISHLMKHKNAFIRENAICSF